MSQWCSHEPVISCKVISSYACDFHSIKHLSLNQIFEFNFKKSTSLSEDGRYEHHITSGPGVRIDCVWHDIAVKRGPYEFSLKLKSMYEDYRHEKGM